MVAPIRTIYDTSVELALLSIDSDGMDVDELSLAVYQKASKFSAVLADQDLIESIRYVENADIRRVRVVETAEDGSYILVADPKEEVAAALMATVEEAVENAMTDDAPEVPEPVEEGVEDAENAPVEDGSAKQEVPANPKHAEKEYEKMYVVTDGILGADVAAILPECTGKVCDVYIGNMGHYSLMNTYSKELADKVVKIEIAGE